MTNSAQGEALSNEPSRPRGHDVTEGFHRLRVLFCCVDIGLTLRCIEKLREAQFAVDVDSISAATRCSEQMHSQSYGVVVSQYRSSPEGKLDLQLLQRAVRETPLILLATEAGAREMAETTGQNKFDYVEQGHLRQLPMAVRRAVNDRKLRLDLEEVGKTLLQSQSRHRALLDNPAYGVCQCDAEGKLLDVNRALVSMLGYASKEELLAANRAGNKFPAPSRAFGVVSPELVVVEPVEVEWRRKDGTALKVRLSGGGQSVNGDVTGYEIIVVDLTPHWAIERELRAQASTDVLTGLANYRRLAEALHAEIERANRTEREFSLLLLDLDQLKKINDEFGHGTGDRALYRLAMIMLDCCRSIDTAARQGGDEFAVVLPETGKEAASLVADRISELLAKDTENPKLSVSIGIASFPADADTIAALVSAADKALYETKGKRLIDSRAAGA